MKISEIAIENLGRLASKCELESREPNLFEFERSNLQRLARRYRSLQAQLLEESYDNHR